MQSVKRIALQRVHLLFRRARESIYEDPGLAQRYVEVARKISMRTNLRLPREYTHMVCRHCKSFIFPSVTSRVRIQSRREPHVVITCFICGSHARIPLRRDR